MAHIAVERELDLQSPVLVEGLPGVGLVGKIATDHLIDALELTLHATCHCEGLPEVATYRSDDYTLRPPVRIYGDEDRDLLALQSDVPVSPSSASDFTGCLVEWFEQEDVLPICLSGLPQEKGDGHDLYGVGIGAGRDRLAEHDIEAPAEGGLISGPTGAILARANEVGLDSIGLVVRANAKFPDPAAARILIERGIEPLANVEVDTAALVDHAEEIAAARAQLARQMEQADEESTQARPVGMFQ